MGQIICWMSLPLITQRFFCIRRYPLLNTIVLAASEPAAGQDKVPLGAGGYRVVVGYDDEGFAEFFGLAVQDIGYIVGVLGVEVAGRLIGKDDFGVVYHGAGDGNPLPFPAGKFGGEVAGSFQHPHVVQKAAGPFQRLFFRSARHKRRQHHIFERRKIFEQVMKLKNKPNVLFAVCRQGSLPQRGNFEPVDQHRPRIRLIQPAQNVEEGALAAATLPAYRNGCATLNLKTESLQDPQGFRTRYVIFYQVQSRNNYIVQFSVV